jgi:hypothetical protein
MRKLSYPTILAAAVAGGAFAGALPGSAAAEPFNCSASAIRVSVLGQSVAEPVTANAGQGACQTVHRTLGDATSALPAPVSAAGAGAQTDMTGAGGPVAGQQADAVGTVNSLAVRGLPALPITLPGIQIPASLAALSVPLPASLQALGLPASITVNALAAVQSLVPTRTLPNLDVVDVDTAASWARARCVSGVPNLSGMSAVSGLRVLGQSLPTDHVVDQALTLIGGGQVNPSAANLGLVQLPAGLSFGAPVIGPQLQAAVQSALAALAPIAVPATVAQAKVTPAEQTESGGTLTQRALHIQVSLLGQGIADVVLGVAQVSDAGVSCAAPATAPAVEAGPTLVSELAVSCTKRRLTLIDVLDRGDRVSLLGAADRSLIGRTVQIVFTATGRRVASAKVRPDGSFRTTAPIPPDSVRFTNRARYEAVVGGERSLRLKLERRMIIRGLRARGGTVVMSGRVTGPLATPREEIVIQRRVSCTRYVTVERIVPRPDGRWSVRLPAPPHEQAAVYRAATHVRKVKTNRKLYPTFTLPGYVSL